MRPSPLVLKSITDLFNLYQILINKNVLTLDANNKHIVTTNSDQLAKAFIVDKTGNTFLLVEFEDVMVAQKLKMADETILAHSNIALADWLLAMYKPWHNVEEMEHSFLPIEANCPIYFTPFIAPYINFEGRTYEEVVIRREIRRVGIDPFTRNPLDSSQIAPNLIIHELMWLIMQHNMEYLKRIKNEIKPPKMAAEMCEEMREEMPVVEGEKNTAVIEAEKNTAISAAAPEAEKNPAANESEHSVEKIEKNADEVHELHHQDQATELVEGFTERLEQLKEFKKSNPLSFIAQLRADRVRMAQLFRNYPGLLDMQSKEELLQHLQQIKLELQRTNRIPFHGMSLLIALAAGFIAIMVVVMSIIGPVASEGGKWLTIGLPVAPTTAFIATVITTYLAWVPRTNAKALAKINEGILAAEAMQSDLENGYQLTQDRVAAEMSYLCENLLLAGVALAQDPEMSLHQDKAKDRLEVKSQAQMLEMVIVPAAMGVSGALAAAAFTQADSFSSPSVPSAFQPRIGRYPSGMFSYPEMARIDPRIKQNHACSDSEADCNRGLNDLRAAEEGSSNSFSSLSL